MGWFDDSFDPAQFAVGGGLLGRLSSMQPFNQFPAGDGFPALPMANAGTPAAIAVSSGPTGPAPQNPTQPSPVPPALAPDLATRLSAGFQSWAHTPVGSPFAGLANGIAGFNSGQRVLDPGIGTASDDGDAGSTAQAWAPTNRNVRLAKPQRRRSHGG